VAKAATRSLSKHVLLTNNRRVLRRRGDRERTEAKGGCGDVSQANISMTNGCNFTFHDGLGSIVWDGLRSGGIRV
jgi:hypothetical protein